MYSSKKEEMGSSCSTNTASATTSVKGAGSMDKFVQPVTVMKGEKLDISRNERSKVRIIYSRFANHRIFPYTFPYQCMG